MCELMLEALGCVIILLVRFQSMVSTVLVMPIYLSNMWESPFKFQMDWYIFKNVINLKVCIQITADELGYILYMNSLNEITEMIYCTKK